MPFKQREVWFSAHLVLLKACFIPIFIVLWLTWSWIELTTYRLEVGTELLGHLLGRVWSWEFPGFPGFPAIFKLPVSREIGLESREIIELNYIIKKSLSAGTYYTIWASLVHKTIRSSH